MNNAAQNLTQNERIMLLAIHGCELHDGNDPTGEPVYLEYATAPFDPASAGGIMASLVKKGLAETDGAHNGDDATCWITDSGVKALS